MKRQLTIGSLFLGLLFNSASANESATDALLEHLDPVKYSQGEFTQRLYGDGDEIIARTSGTFRMLKPSWFAWEIQAPDRQLIISDPQHLWHFDEDLQTVTRRPVEGREEMAPLQVLGGDAEVLRQRFDVVKVSPQKFRLSPKAGDPGFQSLTVEFEEQRIARIEVLDSLNQRVEVRFQNVSNDTELTAADFVFSPPEGADLFYYDQ